ncbi:retrovirus-related pol polyprotein from transposon TNT 1-94 [Tanacetum coccineum]
MASNEETNAAGTDTRPPMLVESEYVSWKIRILGFFRGKPSANLLELHSKGTSTHLMVTDAPTEVKAGFYSQRKKILFDEFERFCAIGMGMLQGVQRTKEKRRILSTSKIDVAHGAWNKKGGGGWGSYSDAEAEAIPRQSVEYTAPYDQPLAMATINIFEVNHEDAYDSDVDEGPNAAAAFMANCHHIRTNELHHHYGLIERKTSHVRDCNWGPSNEKSMPIDVCSSEGTVLIMRRDICSIVLYSAVAVTPSSNCSCDNLRLECDREHNKVLELEAEISKQKRLITESEKRFAFLEQNYVSLQLKFQNYKQCSDTSSASNAIFEINKLRDQLQGKDATIRNLDAQINIMKVLNVGSTEGSCDQQALDTDRIQLQDMITSLRIQLDGLKVENVSLKRRYDELSKANTHSRTAYTEKLSALTAEHTKLQAQVTGKTSSGPSTSETPKVLAPGMYNLGSKYIPPPKRANWVKSTQLPKTKQVTFIEPPRPSLKPTQKPVVHHNKQTNVCVPLSTGVKPTSGANKPVPKRAPRNHSSLPAKSTNARRVEAHHRILNKKNRVDSHLLVKHSIFVSNSNNVCGACNKSLVSATHNACLVLCDDSVNWKPTGRHFSLYEMHPLTRILEPSVEPIELSPSVKSSAHITMISRFPDCKLCDPQSGSKGISGCSRHMTGDRARLINFVEKFIGTVRFGNDDYAAIVGYGDYKLGDTIISRVYYVEGLKHNLFSVGQFCDGGLEVAFRQHSCHIRNYDMVDLLKGSRTTNLYSISLNDMMSACLVMCDDSVNDKPHPTKRSTRQPTKEWKPINKVGKPIKRVWNSISKNIANTKPQWKPTGRHFSLYELHPLTRIMEPSAETLALSPSVSSSAQITMISRFPDCKFCDPQSGSKGISGCSRHMTGDRARLINFVEKFIGTVRFGNDEYAAIVGYGDYKLGDTIISRVYYVEGLKHNLFSVGQFCDGGLEVAFRQHSCHIRNYDMMDLLKGSRTTNLYSISLNDMLPTSPVCLCTKASSTKSWLWHRRLNHLNFGTLNELARNDLVRGLPMLKYDKDHLCPSCQLGKSKKASHPLKTENTNTEVLHTLHMDLCGPMRTESINGKKYVLVIVDDYTRFGWVRFLRTKDETPQVIEKFIVKTQRALNATVRFVRTYNGTEFVNKLLDG